MRELNEQELEQVAGGSGFTFAYVASENAGGAAVAGHGVASSKSFVASTNAPDFSTSTAANKGFAFGSSASVLSGASSVSSVTISQ